MLDRFDILVFSTQWKAGRLTVPLKEIYQKVMRAYEFCQKRKQKDTNARLSLQELESSLSSFLKSTQFSSHISSKRRKKSILKVARTIADLNADTEIKAHYIEQAKELSFTPFMQIKNRGAFP